MSDTTTRKGGVVIDDGARHADTVTHQERLPRFDRNGLHACEKTVFTPDHKRRAWDLMRSA